MQFLKQSTAITLKIGPFLDDTDGKTAETGLTITQADIRLSKNGGDLAQKNESTSCTHDELGIYGCPVDTTDTGTLGRLQLWVHKSGALPVWHEYMILSANTYDSLFGSDQLEVDLLQIGGITQSATDLKDFADSGYDPSTHKVEAVKANDDMRGTDNAALASVCTEARLAELAAANLPADIDTLLSRITAAVALASICTEGRLAHLDADISSRSSHAAADVWAASGRELSTPNNYKADISAVALEATLTAIKGDGWSAETLKAIKDAVDTITLTAAAIADAVWDEVQSGHTSAGTFGKYLDAQVSGVGGAVGSGALECTWTQKDSEEQPIDNVAVWITTDEAGTNVIAGTLYTDANGQVTFMLDAGTYYVWRELAGYNFTNPQEWSVS